MKTISINYNSVWQLKNKPNYVITKCGKLYNKKSGKFIKKVVKGYTIGFNIDSKFISINKLRSMLEKINKNNCPF
jgi:DeoR/GlpR family transcriptional regulator of sugar metabolism